MKLAFAKGDNTWFDQICRWRTGGIHTHVEFVFSDGISFSSSQWDGGCRFKEIDYSNPEKWSFVEVGDIDEEALKRWCMMEDSKKYDWLGVLRIFTGRKKHGPDSKWFCSEICTAGLQRFGILKHLEAGKTSPEALWIAAVAREEARLEFARIR